MAGRECDERCRLAVEVWIRGDKEGLGALPDESREGGSQVAFRHSFSENDLDPKRGCRDLRVCCGLLRSRETRVREQTDHGRSGSNS